jgi:hypothetical protein
MPSFESYHSLNNWYKYLFEHLGYIILAKEHNMIDKIMVYSRSLEKFCIEVDDYINKNSKIADDKKNDLIQLKSNVLILKNYFLKL